MNKKNLILLREKFCLLNTNSPDMFISVGCYFNFFITWMLKFFSLIFNSFIMTIFYNSNIFSCFLLATSNALTFYRFGFVKHIDTSIQLSITIFTIVIRNCMRWNNAIFETLKQVVYANVTGNREMSMCDTYLKLSPS